MSEAYKKRYEGVRWQIVYGSFDGLERTAVIELQRAVQSYFPYVVEVVSAADAIKLDGHLLLVGKTDTHPMLAELVRKEALAAPQGAQSFSLAGFSSPYAGNANVVAIAGTDAEGVFYGVRELIASVMPDLIRPNYPHERQRSFDALTGFARSDRPRVTERGLWSWGYTIYDYRRYLDAMARLRMNMLTIWNDAAPANLDAVLDYAHARGIKVIMGFSWGWGRKNLNLACEADCEWIRQQALDIYTRQYSGMNLDGIYFQTITECKNTEIDGKSVASLACALANKTARSIWEVAPDLTIQFGLHASSIADKYEDLKDLDPRMVIVWEDAGLLPYSYQASLDPKHSYVASISTLEETLAYSRKLAGFRPDTPFGMVPKGWAWLDWAKEFEHHGEFIMGERDPRWIAARATDRQDRWKWIDAAWTQVYPAAARFYAEMLAVQPSLLVTGLVEDGMIEAGIPISVALFAETLWDPCRDSSKIMAAALSIANSNAG